MKYIAGSLADIAEQIERMADQCATQPPNPRTISEIAARAGEAAGLRRAAALVRETELSSANNEKRKAE